MICWKVAFLFFVLVIRRARLSCHICQQECSDIASVQPISVNLSIICDDEDTNLVSFIAKNNFSELQSLTLKSPKLLNLNLTKFHNVSYLNLSENNITFVNISQFQKSYFINLSHNSIESLVLPLLNLTLLDLSSNRISNLSTIALHPVISHLIVHNNIIASVGNFSSNSLKYFDLSNNRIEELQIGYCPNLKQLLLNNNFIKKIPSKLYKLIPNLEILNLSSNYLLKLEDNSFNLTNLLQIDLSNNKIYSLSQKCFSGLNRLQVLNISLNKIQTVSPSTFQYLNGLFQLVVSENKELSSQDFGLLLASRRLKSVYASKTNQNKIPSSLTRSVRYLVLSFNNISQIQCGDLDSYPLLNSLDLANNKIGYIEDDALGRLELLTVLNLSQNFLLSIPRTLPNNLKYLFIRMNMIKILNGNDLNGLQQLNELDVSFNLIEAIKDSAFLQLGSLEILNLSGNKIVTLSISSFSSLQNLKVLDLSFLQNITECNQFQCFPVPDHNQLQELKIKNSPVLANMFINDVAALKTFEQLIKLDISYSNITTIRKDFPTYLTRLNHLDIQGNPLNCSSVKQVFSWFHLRELPKCVFKISEKHSPENISSTDNILLNNQDLGEVRKIDSQIYETSKHTTDFNKYDSFSKEYLYANNKSEIYSNIIDPDLLTSEFWFKNQSHGIVDAYSSEETPTSHPGLFVLLLLPIALISTCLFLHYSHAKRNRNNPIGNERDIEISNISSELW